MLRESDVLGTALRLTHDDIPNIRFNVAKALETIAAVVAGDAEGQSIIENDIIPALDKMMEDSDADVRYYASRAKEKTVQGGAEPMNRESWPSMGTTPR